MLKPSIFAALIATAAVSPAAATGSKQDVCQKIGEVMAPHLQNTLKIAHALTAQRLTGTPDEKKRAEELFQAISQNQSELTKGLEEIFELCTDG